MSYLFLYLAITIVGYFIGAKLKKKGRKLSWASPLQTVVIVVLVFLMGSRIGANEEIVASLGTIGLVSLAYTVIVLAVTCAAYSVARRLMGFDRYGIRGSGSSAQTVSEGSGGATVNRLTVMIVFFVAIGIAAGYFVLPQAFIAWTGTLLTISLCILLVLIGIDIGTAGTLAVNFRSAGWRVLVFPFVSMAAMVIGSFIASLILPSGPVAAALEL